MTDPAPEPDSTATEQPAAPPSNILARAQGAGPRRREGGEAWVFSFRDQVAELLAGRVRDVDGYLFNVFRQIAASKPLIESTRASLAGGILLGATLGFEVGGPLGHFYFTPRWNRNAVRVVDGKEVKGAFECVPVIGYKGFFELGYRSGHVAAYEYVRVREGDTYDSGADSERGNWWTWKQMPGGSPTRPLTHVVAIAKLLSGQRSSLPMTIDEILSRRPTQWEKTPWGKAEFADAMATKTPFREQAKFLRLSTDLALAADADERVSLWNQQTEAIETRHDDLDDTIVVTGEAAEPIDENAPEPDEGAYGAENAPELAPEYVAADPEPARGRTAPRADTSKIAPQDLPAFVKAEGREMTEDEFERFSAWEAGQARG